MVATPVILWDVMSTLVEEPFYAAMPAFFGMDLPTLLQEKHPTAWIDFEAGRLDEAAYLACFFKDGRAVDGEGLKAALRAAYAWMPGVEAVLADLKAAAVPMYALSNYAPWYRIIEDELALSRYLGWDFVSCETGHRKPDPEAYLHAARSLGVPTCDCVFVDDREENVVAAEAVGMQGILRGPDVEGLRVALARLGVPGAMCPKE
ncbi:MAG: HAD family phosphatase [Myxococcales bacterium]|nr:HAD family phosphatase [Myxococcales bacterium]